MSIKIMVCQAKIKDDKIKILERYLRIASKNKVDLMVLPEAFIDFNKNVKLEDKIKNLISSFKINSILGAIKGKRDIAIMVNSKGEIKNEYTKICLFADEKERYIKGKEIEIINIKGYKICPIICYDSFFPEISRKCLKVGADIIVVVAAINTKQEEFWYSLIRTRSNENQIPIVCSCCYSPKKSIFGGSCIAEPYKKLKFIKNPTKKDYIISTINPNKYKEFKEIESPRVNAKILFKKSKFGPYIKDLIK